MTTANDVVSGTLRLISSLPPGEGIPGLEADAALSALNMMLASWSADNLMPPCRTLESFALAAGINSRTIGSGAQLDTVRPDYVTGAYLRDATGYDKWLDTFMTKGEYNAITNKSVQARPERLYYDTQYPNGVLYFDAATDATYTLFLESTKPVNQFSTLSATLLMPGEYAHAIKFLLVDELAPEYGFIVQPGSRLSNSIDMARKMILRKNAKPRVVGFDAALSSPPPFDINAG